MKIEVEGREIDFCDIKETLYVNPREYHIDNIKPFLVIVLKSGERIYTNNVFRFVKSK